MPTVLHSWGQRSAAIKPRKVSITSYRTTCTLWSNRTDWLYFTSAIETGVDRKKLPSYLKYHPVFLKRIGRKAKSEILTSCPYKASFLQAAGEKKKNALKKNKQNIYSWSQMRNQVQKIHNRMKRTKRCENSSKSKTDCHCFVCQEMQEEDMIRCQMCSVWVHVLCVSGDRKKTRFSIRCAMFGFMFSVCQETGRRHDSVLDVQCLGSCSLCVRRQEKDTIQY